MTEPPRVPGVSKAGMTEFSRFPVRGTAVTECSRDPRVTIAENYRYSPVLTTFGVADVSALRQLLRVPAVPAVSNPETLELQAASALQNPDALLYPYLCYEYYSGVAAATGAAVVFSNLRLNTNGSICECCRMTFVECKGDDRSGAQVLPAHFLPRVHSEYLESTCGINSRASTHRTGRTCGRDAIQNPREVLRVLAVPAASNSEMHAAEAASRLQNPRTAGSNRSLSGIER